MRKYLGLFAGLALIFASAFALGYTRVPACLFIESKPDAVMVKGLDKVRMTHPGIVVGEPFTDVPKIYPFSLRQPPLEEFHLIPPPPADENAPMWVVPKRIDV